jgi:hypothetical protein
MRRLFVLLAGLGVLPAAAGCHHTAGFCDCQPAVNPCCVYGLYPADAHAPAAVAHDPPVAMPVKERLGMPREGL